MPLDVIIRTPIAEYISRWEDSGILEWLVTYWAVTILCWIERNSIRMRGKQRRGRNGRYLGDRGERTGWRTRRVPPFEKLDEENCCREKYLERIK